MSASLPVELNRRSLHSIDVANEFEASESFSIDLRNRGEAVHVHVHLDDDLSRAASIPRGNYYVGTRSTESVAVTTNVVDEPVRGKLKIVTGYGAETAYVTVTVVPGAEETPTVEIDESLSRPQQPEPEPSAMETLSASAAGPGATLAVAAGVVLIALAVGFYLQSAAVLVGVGVVIGVAAAAVLFAIR